MQASSRILAFCNTIPPLIALSMGHNAPKLAQRQPTRSQNPRSLLANKL
jgi:hypothetical protein